MAADKKNTVFAVLAIACVVLLILSVKINGKRRFEAQRSVTLEIELEEALEAKISLGEELKDLETELEEALSYNESLKKELDQLRLENRSLEEKLKGKTSSSEGP